MMVLRMAVFEDGVFVGVFAVFGDQVPQGHQFFIETGPAIGGHIVGNQHPIAPPLGQHRLGGIVGGVDVEVRQTAQQNI
jgi:hypothetical protein